MIIGHVYGAYLCQTSNPVAAAGLCIVALAAFCGIFRFGVAIQPWQPIHAAFAELAAFVGFPLIGQKLRLQHLHPALGLHDVLSDPAVDVAMVVVLYTLARSSPAGRSEAGLDAFRTIFVILGFVGPALFQAFGSTEGRGAFKNQLLGASVLLFVAVGLVAGADRSRSLIGFRRENWFHYVAALAAVGIGAGLA